jgi:hypothetical protein
MSRRRRALKLSLVLAMAAAVMLTSAGVAQALNNAPGTTHFLNRASGKCLDVYTESPWPGEFVDQLTCRNAAAQEWAVRYAATINDHREGSCQCTYDVYTIVNNNGGNCVTVPEGFGGNGAPVIQDVCTAGAIGQWWRLVTAEYSVGPPNIRVPIAWTIRNYRTGKCLDVPGGSSNDELPMQVWDCFDGNFNQRWAKV